MAERKLREVKTIKIEELEALIESQFEGQFKLFSKEYSMDQSNLLRLVNGIQEEASDHIRQGDYKIARALLMISEKILKKLAPKLRGL